MHFCSQLSIGSKTSRSSKSRISNQTERFRYDLLDPATDLPLELPRGSLLKASEFLGRRKVYQLIQFREPKGASTIRRDQAEADAFTDRELNTLASNMHETGKKQGHNMNKESDKGGLGGGAHSENNQKALKSSLNNTHIMNKETTEEGKEEYFRVVIGRFDLMTVEEEDRVKKEEEERHLENNVKGKGKNKRKK